jgi:hypothetical protein
VVVVEAVDVVVVEAVVIEVVDVVIEVVDVEVVVVEVVDVVVKVVVVATGGLGAAWGSRRTAAREAASMMTAAVKPATVRFILTQS